GEVRQHSGRIGASHQLGDFLSLDDRGGGTAFSLYQDGGGTTDAGGAGQRCGNRSGGIHLAGVETVDGQQVLLFLLGVGGEVEGIGLVRVGRRNRASGQASGAV